MRKLFPLMAFFLLVSQSSFSAYNDFNQDHLNQQRDFEDLNDTERHTTDRTSTMSGPEIEAYQAARTTVINVVFRDGKKPQDSRLDTIGFDQQSGEAGLTATGKFGDFSGDFKEQILSKFQEANQTGILLDNSPISVDATVSRDNSFMVHQVRPAQQQDLAAVNANQDPAPMTQNESVSLPARQNDQPASREIPTPAQGETVRPQVTTPLVQNEQAPATLSGPPPETNVSPAEFKEAVQSIASELGADTPSFQPGVVLTAQTGKGPSINPVATLALGDGSPAVVSEVKKNPDGTKDIRIEAPLGALPAGVQQEVESPTSLSPQTNVEIQMTVNPNGTVEIASAKPLATTPLINQDLGQIAPANSQASPSQLAVQPNASPRETANPDLNTADRSAAVTQTDNNQLPSDSQIPILIETIAGDPQENPYTVSVEAPEPNRGPLSTTQGLTAVVEFENGEQFKITEFKSEEAGEETRYEVEGQFNQFSEEMREEVTNIADQWGVSDLLSSETQVELKLNLDSNENTELTSIRLTNDNPSLEEGTVVLISLTPKGGEEAEGLIDPNIGQPDQDNPSSSLVGLAPAPSQKPNLSKSLKWIASAGNALGVKGLAPSLSALAQKALQFKKGGFKAFLKNKESPYDLTLADKNGNKNSIDVSWREGNYRGQYDFMIEGKAIEFSDQIRQQVYKKLKEAAEKGEVWAKKAMENQFKLVLELSAQENKETGEIDIILKDVFPNPGDLAKFVQDQMGLADEDYTVASDGHQGILMLNPGSRAQLKAGFFTPISLVAPDGGINILLKKKPTSKEEGATFFASRKSLRANLAALAEASFDADTSKKVKNTLNDNPQVSHFMVQVNINNSGNVVVTPIIKPDAKKSSGRKKPKKKKDEPDF